MNDPEFRDEIEQDASAFFADYSLRDHEIVDYPFYNLPQ